MPKFADPTLIPKGSLLDVLVTIALFTECYIANGLFAVEVYSEIHCSKWWAKVSLSTGASDKCLEWAIEVSGSDPTLFGDLAEFLSLQPQLAGPSLSVDPSADGLQEIFAGVVSWDRLGVSRE